MLPVSTKRVLRTAAKAVLKFAAKTSPTHFRRLAIAAHNIAGVKPPAPVRINVLPLKNEHMLALGTLAGQLSHGSAMKLLLDAGAITLAQSYLWANKLYADRHFEELESFFAIEDPGLQPIQAYLRERLNDYKGHPALRVGDILPVILSDNRYGFLFKPVVNLYVQQLCRVRRVVEAADIAMAHPVKVFSPQTIMGLANGLIAAKEQGVAAELMARYLSGADTMKQLYFHEVATSLGRQSLISIPLTASWRQLLQIYADNCAPVDSNDASDISTYLIEPLRRIPDDARDLLDIRSSQDERDALTNIVVTSICQKTPLSLIRLGDGESYCFEGAHLSVEVRTQCAADNLIREVHWWGENVPTDVRCEIRSQARLAIENADILGIPGAHRIIRDRGSLKRRLMDSRQKRGIAVVLPEVLNRTERHRVLTEERIHQVLFHAPYLSALSRHAVRTVVISCWKSDELASLDLRNPEYIVIPGATKVRGRGVRPLFETYKETLETIKSAAAPGVLLLVGGGLIGKIFIDAAKREGAVAIDVGSVMDYFAGRATRNIADMVI